MAIRDKYMSNEATIFSDFIKNQLYHYIAKDLEYCYEYDWNNMKGFVWSDNSNWNDSIIKLYVGFDKTQNEYRFIIFDKENFEFISYNNSNIVELYNHCKENIGMIGYAINCAIEDGMN